MSESFELDDVDGFVPTTVGVPGARTFFLHIDAHGHTIAVRCEKLHVAALAQALQQLLTDLPPVGHAIGPRPERSERHAEWSLGTIGLGYASEADRVLVLLQEADPSGEGRDDPDDGTGARIRLSLTRAQARAFAAWGEELVGAGRPTCPTCSTPIDPTGFNCACFN